MEERTAVGNKDLKGALRAGSGALTDRIPGAWMLLAVFLFAIVLRIALGLSCEALPDYSDMAGYNRLATEGGFNTYRPPLYPLFLRIIYFVFGRLNYKAVFVVQGIIGSLVVPLLYMVASKLCGRRAGMLAAAAGAVYPAFLVYNLTTLTESLSVVFAVSIMAAAVVLEPGRRRAALLALLAGAGALFKPAIIFFAPGIFLVTRRKLVFLLVLAAVLTPWTVRNAVVHREFVPLSNTGPYNFYLSYNPDGSPFAEGPRSREIRLRKRQRAIAEGADVSNPVGPPEEYVAKALAYIRGNKIITVDLIRKKAALLWGRGWDKHVLERIVPDTDNWHYTMMYIYVPFVILGFAGMARYYRRSHRPLVLPVLSYAVLSVLLSIFKIRFRVLVEPMVIVYASMLLSGEGKAFVHEGSAGEAGKEGLETPDRSRQ